VLITPEANLRPQRAGLYRWDRQDDITSATAVRGTLLLDDTVAFPIDPGLRVELWREAPRTGRDSSPRGELRHRSTGLPQDAFAQWLAQQDAREERTASLRHVSPEMTGAEELDRHGRWERHPEFGVVWFPLNVAVGWAPYQVGRWVWVRPWGWTWVDANPWGFAPFHYGRWVSYRGRWCWVPGAYVARPAFSPGLVAWVGGPAASVTVTIGGRGRPLPGSSWVPLAPHETYRPWYPVPRPERRHPVHPVHPVHPAPQGRPWDRQEPSPRVQPPMWSTPQLPSSAPPAVTPPAPSPRPDRHHRPQQRQEDEARPRLERPQGSERASERTFDRPNERMESPRPVAVPPQAPMAPSPMAAPVSVPAPAPAPVPAPGWGGPPPRALPMPGPAVQPAPQPQPQAQPPRVAPGWSAGPPVAAPPPTTARPEPRADDRRVRAPEAPRSGGGSGGRERDRDRDREHER
jgi:hypothetical protein